MTDLGYQFKFAADIEMYGMFDVRDVFTLEKEDLEHCDLIITNPPWSRPVLHPMIEKFMSLGKETYLLFDSDWMFTKQATPYIDKWLTDVISVGRMNWIAGTKVKSLDNCSWYRFMPRKFSNITYWSNPLYSK